MDDDGGEVYIVGWWDRELLLRCCIDNIVHCKSIDNIFW